MPVFASPYYCWLLAVLLIPAGLYLRARMQKKKTASILGDAALIRKRTSSYSPGRYFQKWLLALLALILLVLALANPRQTSTEAVEQTRGMDLVLALDLSSSMLAKDLAPSRLDRARQTLIKLTESMGNHRVALVFFAGNAYLQMPLTEDHALACEYLAAAHPEHLPSQGTSLAEALQRASEAFNPNDKKYRAILLLSDGENHEPDALETARKLADEGIPIHTIGFGTRAGAPVPNEQTGTYLLDADGRQVISVMNPLMLEDIARAGGGTYHSFASSEKTIQHILGQLNNQQQRPVVREESRTYRYFFPVLLILALMLLFVESIWPETNRFRKKAVAVIILTVMNTSLYAQQPSLQDGHKAYREGKFAEAEQIYRQYSQKEPSQAAVRFNLGNALFRKGDYAAASEQFQEAAGLFGTEKSQMADAWYNQALSLQRAQKMNEAITAYKQALKLQPGHEDARHNLQKALRNQQQQQSAKPNPKNESKKDKPREQDPKNKPTMNRQEAEQTLKRLRQEERNLQDKLNRTRLATPNRNEKNW